jgi:uncharacterized RDD family membrane protein YckC
VDTLRIQTAQHVEITFAVAGIGDRAIASLIDLFIQGAILAGTFVLLASMRASSPWFFGVMAMITLYHPLCETLFDGQSPGKRQQGIRVARVDGTRPGVGAYAMRWLLGLVEIWMTFGLVALLAVLLGRRGQRLGDLAAGTAVVRVRRSADIAGTGLMDDAPAEPAYPEVTALSSKDIQTIREVLNQSRANGRNARTERLLRRTKEVVERKMSLPPVDEQPYRFLVRVLKDYNGTGGRTAD